MKQDALQLTGGAGKDKRRDLDYYPTPPDCTKALMNFLNIPAGRIIWEPACGELYMSKVLESYDHTVISTDIQNGEDFFELSKECYAIITNPPFEHAEAFIKRSIEMPGVRLVAMLLKSQYWHSKKRATLFNKYPPTHVLPLTWRPDFKFHLRKPGDKKSAPTMEVCWSVWNKSSSSSTTYQPLLKP